MVSQRTLQALIAIWHELPLLVGPSWVDLYSRMNLHEILTCQDSVERDWLIFDALELLRPHTAAAARLEEVRTIFGMDPGTRSKDHIHPTPLPDWKELLEATAYRLDPPAQTRYTDITSPGRLPLGRRSVITLRLTLEPETRSAHVEELVVRPERTLEAHLVTFDRRLGILGERVKKLVVDRDADSETVVFYVLGQEPGTASLRLALRQDGQPVGTVPLEIEIVDESATEEPLEVPHAAVRMAGPYTAPADLELQVLWRQDAGQMAFCFVMHSPTGIVDAYYREFPSAPIVGSPESYQKRLLGSLEEATSVRLDSIGENLFEDLIPRELATLCREIQRSKAKTMEITSDEPWIPWELLKPDTPGNDPEPFWCERFDITRWLAGEVRPRSRIHVERLACIEASSTQSGEPCRGTADDLRYLSQLARSSAIHDASLGSATQDALGELLDRGEIDLWHFAAPGILDEHGETIAIQLIDGDLKLLDLDRRRRNKIAADRPLVVLNVSGAGRQEQSLTGVGGWASIWVARSQCGAFVAPLWAVDSDLAHEFTRSFYEALRRGEKLGQAVSSARKAVREKGDGDPAWLAYCAYGHPNGRVVIGNAPK